MLKFASFIISVTLLLTAIAACGQGTLQIDQQAIGTAGSPFIIQNFEPVGQSFTPATASVGFIQLVVGDANPDNSLGGTVMLNLRSGSITGPIVSSTTPVTMMDGYAYYTGTSVVTTFLFPTAVSVTPGTMYYFDIVPQTGSDSWTVIGRDPSSPRYAGGTGYAGGHTTSDLWFTEGVVVPEPSAAWLALAGGGLFFCVRCWQKSPRRQT